MCIGPGRYQSQRVQAQPGLVSPAPCPGALRRAPLLLQYVKVGIADPGINWIDLGASRRTAKSAIGFTGYPVRCSGGGGLARPAWAWGRKAWARGLTRPPRSPSYIPPRPSARPCSIYIRCKNSVQEALYSQMMAIYFKKDDLINDP